MDTKLPDRFRQNAPLWSTVDTVTGQVGEGGKVAAKLGNLRLDCYPSGRNQVTGSLHKFSNSGLHNWDDFGYIKLCETVHDLSQRLGFDPARARLHGFEFGVNLSLNQTAKSFIQNIISYGGHELDVDTFKGRGYEKRIEADRYTLKVYDKSMQHRAAPSNLLRVEAGIREMRYVSGLGIHSLADLLNPRKLERLGQTLNDLFNHLLIAERFQSDPLTLPERKVVEQCTRSEFWAELNDYRRRHYYRSKYTAICNKYGRNSGRVVSELVAAKWSELLGDNPEDWRNAATSKIKRLEKCAV